ncbi:hypothetical protein GGTG_09288 [Gaeumannomyces tritici R3-111a-1]|uniref:Uncharacterized protein n=1 Tax=Gaeumannomyces tritici (strain R3-111a-1) TaxID=644352 RepID=J3P6Z1_GAET3|nr:hypothetical protein GGTG_09288 [Gaeumannomyces tritici R3-111a-1]EJT72422.1 hypothetical protein GGTG_09288 [Gaeumannomyces tritici R3-111a-1]
MGGVLLVESSMLKVLHAKTSVTALGIRDLAGSQLGSRRNDGMFHADADRRLLGSAEQTRGGVGRDNRLA